MLYEEYITVTTINAAPYAIIGYCNSQLGKRRFPIIATSFSLHPFGFGGMGGTNAPPCGMGGGMGI